jgi:hypothetical protein
MEETRVTELQCESIDLQVNVKDLESLIGRQAFALDSAVMAINESNANYRKLIGVVAQIVSGEISLDRFKILPDGLSWQVLPLVEATVTDQGELINDTTHPRPE